MHKIVQLEIANAQLQQQQQHTREYVCGGRCLSNIHGTITELWVPQVQ